MGEHARFRRGRPLRNAMTPDQEPPEALACRGVQTDTLALREGGRQAIDGDVQPQRLLDHLPSCGHRITRRRGKDNLLPPLRDSGKRIDRQ